MARRKAEESVIEAQDTSVVEGAIADPVAVEEKPKAKRGRKPKTEVPAEDKVEEAAPVEVAPVEEPEAEVIAEAIPEEAAPVVEEPKEVEQKIEEPVVAETPKSDDAAELPYKAIVEVLALQIRKGPSITSACIGHLPKGTRVTITELDGNWGRIGATKWININSTKKI